MTPSLGVIELITRPAYKTLTKHTLKIITNLRIFYVVIDQLIAPFAGCWHIKTNSFYMSTNASTPDWLITDGVLVGHALNIIRTTSAPGGLVWH